MEQPGYCPRAVSWPAFFTGISLSIKISASRLTVSLYRLLPARMEMNKTGQSISVYIDGPLMMSFPMPFGTIRPSPGANYRNYSGCAGWAFSSIMTRWIVTGLTRTALSVPGASHTGLMALTAFWIPACFTAAVSPTYRLRWRRGTSAV